MAGAYILWREQLNYWSNLAGFAVTLALSHTGTGSSVAAAGLPLTNILDRRQRKVARIIRNGGDGASVTKITASVSGGGAFFSVHGIMLAGYKMTLGGSYVSGLIRFVLKSGAATVYDSGSLTFAADSLTGYSNMFLPVSPSVNAIACTSIEITITPGSGDVVIDIGRLFLGFGIYLANGVDYDLQNTAVDDARVTRSRGKQIYTETVPTYRAASMKITQIPESLALNTGVSFFSMTFQQIALEVGQSGEVLVAPRTATVYEQNRLSMLGRLTMSPVIAHQGGGYYATQLDVEEGL